MGTTHLIESELDQPLPRRSVIWPHVRLGHVGAALFFIPFVVAGLMVALLALQAVATQTVGQRIPARVLSKDESTDSDGDAKYVLTVSYAKGGAFDRGKLSVSKAEYSEAREGVTVAVRYLELPRSSHGALDGNYRTPLFLTVFALIWNVFIIGIIIAVGFQVKQAVTLLRRGKTSVAQITEKTLDDSGDSTTHYLHYRFQADGQTIFGKDSVHSARWSSAQLDEQFTALYLPESPGTCALFKFI